MAEKRALERAQKALRLRHINPFDHEEPFAAVIRCTADQEGRQAHPVQMVPRVTVRDITQAD